MAGTCLPNVYNLYGTEDDEMNDEQSEVYDMTVEEPQGRFYADDLYATSDDEDLMNDEQRALYNKMVEESQGFDVPDLPLIVMGQIVPSHHFDRPVEDLIFCCKLALKHYREKEGKSLKFVKVSKANMRYLSPVIIPYYITFEAKDSRGKVDVYQAEVYYYHTQKEKSKVEIMRLKPTPAVNGATSSSRLSCDCSPDDAPQASQYVLQVIIE